MNEKEFEKLLEQETGCFKRGEMYQAWRDYRYALSPPAEVVSPTLSGTACGLVVIGLVGISLCDIINNPRTDAALLSLAGWAVGISILLYLNSKLKKWRKAQKEEFIRTHPLAHLLFSKKDSQPSTDIGGILKIYD